MDVLNNVIQGSLLKGSSVYNTQNQVMKLPLFVYFDDYEVGNPLGSRAGVNKLGAVYVSIPCIPPEYLSSINHIFLTLLFYSSDRELFGNKAVFSILIREINFFVEEGITISYNNSTVRIFFYLCGILGDNLGLHSILGFTESFSASYCCRYCKAHKESIKRMTIENKDLLRTLDDYTTNINQPLSETGIKEKCVWNEVAGFDVTRNVVVDIMHDMFEGVCNYTISRILNEFIAVDKFFTLDTLNFRVQIFGYVNYEISNKPPLITCELLKNYKFKMSAAEMLCFSRYLSLFVGDLIPKGIGIYT